MLRGNPMTVRSRLVIGVAAGGLAAAISMGLSPTNATASDPPVGQYEYTGTPQTSSAVTQQPNDPAFPGLKVTVSQTEGLVDQAITVSWSGLQPTGLLPGSTAIRHDGFHNNYLQIFECWGNDPNPSIPTDAPQPARETCEFGGATNLSFDITGQATADREANKTDPLERTAVGWNGQPLDYWKNADVPFWDVASGWPHPVAGAAPVTDPHVNSADFNLNSTNEDPFAVTYANGQGQALFHVATSRNAPGLGCGDPVAGPDGTQVGQSCWLVVVPRGDYDLAGYGGIRPGTRVDKIPNQYLMSSPLSATNWSHKLAFKLDYKSVSAGCPLGAVERPVAGSELATEAMTNWQPTLCAQAGQPYSFAQLPEDSARLNLAAQTVGSAPMIFTSQPVPTDPQHPVVYSPVALTGAVIAFTIERQVNSFGTVDKQPTPQAELDLTGSRIAHLNLTPRIVAKLLTESYQRAIAKVPAGSSPPQYLSQDPDFLAVNPEFEYLTATSYASAGADVMVQLPDSDATQALWAWVLADPSARAFLSGQPDPWGMTVNPNYKNLFTAAPATVPKSDQNCFASTIPGAKDLCITDWAPYVNDMHDAAAKTRGCTTGARTTWDPNAAPPQYVANGSAIPGQCYLLSVTDAASAAKYGLQTANLLNADGQFVGPTQAGLEAGAAAMTPFSGTPDMKTLLPTTKTNGAYPLTMLTYGSVEPNGLDTDARKAYAELALYAALDGQTQGLSYGDLPPGYAPLPPDLRLQGVTAASKIISGLPVPATDSGPGSTSLGGPGGTVPDTNALPPNLAASAVAAVKAVKAAEAANQPRVALAAQKTPADPKSIARFAVVIGFLVGISAAALAPLIGGFATRRIPLAGGN